MAGDASSADPVAAYKTILQKVLESRPSGTRQRIATALGKNRSFVSQIASPAYPTPVPARHVELIMEICHFSQAERAAFLEAYGVAHPERKVANGAATRQRTHSISVPDLGDPALNRKFDRLLEDFAQGLADIVLESSGGGDAPKRRRAKGRKGS